MALQIRTYNPIYPSPTKAKEVVAEEFVTKPLIVETVVTIEPTPQPKQNRTLKIEVIRKSNLQCVEYFKLRSGIVRSLGYAGTIQSQGNEPKIGSGALWGQAGHIMYVESVEENGVIISEANYYRGKLTRRFVLFSEIRGYIYS